MTPEEHAALTAALAACETAATALRDILHPGENGPRAHKERLLRQVHRCRCEFGWDPGCPTHRDRAAYYLDPARGVAPPPEDHQDERPTNPGQDSVRERHYPWAAHTD